MTERLTELMRSEADALDVPPVDCDAILDRGRGRVRTRRRATVFLAAAAVLAVVGTGTALGLRGSDDGRDGRATDSIASDGASSGPARGVMAYGAGSKVVVDGTVATIPDTLHSLHYTSVGVLARSNRRGGASDGSGPESLTLVAADGTTTDLGTVPEGVGPATDPDEPVYALAEASGAGFRVVVRDALSGDEVGSVPLPDLPKSYWSVPPLALDGDVVYAGFEQEGYAVNWRTGEVQPAAGLGGGIPDVRDGLALDYGEKLDEATGALDMVVSVVDAATGAPALTVPLEKDQFGSGGLSPDGAHLRFAPEPGAGPGAQPARVDIYDLATQEHVTLAGDGWGWTSGGYPFRVEGMSVDVCDPATGTCTTEAGPGFVKDAKLGGIMYES